MKKCIYKPCGKKFAPRFNSMEKHCSDECKIAWLRSDDGQAAIQKTRRKQDREGRAAERAKKKASREFRKKVQGNDLDYQHGLTKVRFNRMRVLEELLWFRERGIEPYCISCQRTKMDFCCGHYRSVGSRRNTLRYDRKNTYLQCNFHCNKNLSGNINGDKTSIGYKAGLILRFGDEEGQSIIDYCDSHTEPVKWTCDYLIQFRAECAKRIRDLESGSRYT